jgi:hypothetical protein
MQEPGIVFGPIRSVSVRNGKCRVTIVDAKTRTNHSFETDFPNAYVVFNEMRRDSQLLGIQTKRNGRKKLVTQRYGFPKGKVKDKQGYRFEISLNRVQEYYASEDQFEFQRIVALFSEKNNARDVIDFLAFDNEENEDEPILVAVNSSKLKRPPELKRANLENATASVVSRADAENMFTLLASKSTNPDVGPTIGLPFLFPDFGCEVRSHAMSKILIENAVVPQKVWAFPKNVRTFSFRTKFSSRCVVRWGYHTAPAIPSTDGLLVVDPSISPTLLTVSQWADSFSSAADRIIETVSHDVFEINPISRQEFADPNYTLTEQILTRIRAKLFVRFVNDRPPYSCP